MTHASEIDSELGDALVVRADDGLHGFPSTNDAVSYVEPVDVRAGIYEAWDLSGQHYSFRVIERPKRSLFGRRAVCEEVILDPSVASQESSIYLRNHLKRELDIDSDDVRVERMLSLFYARWLTRESRRYR
jgi:hypothetical protein